MNRRQIIPRYKVLMCYDFDADKHDSYFQFITQRLVPAMQEMGLYLFRVYHTAYGNYPVRQLEFLAENLDTIWEAQHSDKWEQVQAKLKEYVSNYSVRIFEFSETFQF